MRINMEILIGTLLLLASFGFFAAAIDDVFR
jgi:hypothetical protein